MLKYSSFAHHAHNHSWNIRNHFIEAELSHGNPVAGSLHQEQESEPGGAYPEDKFFKYGLSLKLRLFFSAEIAARADPLSLCGARPIF